MAHAGSARSRTRRKSAGYWNKKTALSEVRFRVGRGQSLAPSEMASSGLAYLVRWADRKYPGGYDALVTAGGGKLRKPFSEDECRRRLLERADSGMSVNSHSVQKDMPGLWARAKKLLAPETKQWDDVLRACGLDPTNIRLTRAWGDDPFPVLAAIWLRVDRQVSLRPKDVAKADCGLFQIMRKMFGSVENALWCAGIDPDLALQRRRRLSAAVVRRRFREADQRGELLSIGRVETLDPDLAADARYHSGAKRWSDVLRWADVDPERHAVPGTQAMRHGAAFDRVCRLLFLRLRPEWREPRSGFRARTSKNPRRRLYPDMCNGRREWIDFKLTAYGRSARGTVKRYRGRVDRLRLIVLDDSARPDYPNWVTVESIADYKAEAMDKQLEYLWSPIEEMSMPEYVPPAVCEPARWTPEAVFEALRNLPAHVSEKQATVRRYLRGPGLGGLLCAATRQHVTLKNALIAAGQYNGVRDIRTRKRVKRADWGEQADATILGRVRGNRSIRSNAVRMDAREVVRHGRAVHGSWESALQHSAALHSEVRAALLLPMNAKRPACPVRERELERAVGEFVLGRLERGESLRSLDCLLVRRQLVTRSTAATGLSWRNIVETYV